MKSALVIVAVVFLTLVNAREVSCEPQLLWKFKTDG
jgi:hypothetical protein